MLSPDSDRPLDDDEHDEFNFAGIARKLAPSLIAATEGEGMVIGIEGPWGSGKTTMLNLLRKELSVQKVRHLHVINIAPWLGGDNTSLVRTLIDAIAEVVDKLEDEGREGIDRVKDRTTQYGNVLRNYASKTGRGVAPLVKMAGLVYPGAAVAGTMLELGAEFLERFGKAPTEAVLKQAISERLKALDIRFLVLIDDLDRLEPAQAVEVVRIVRSVADFPRVAYVMCYDRGVLANALQVGLKVTNGDLFLQKVVQLTFAIPLPEPFDLRISLRQKALEVYEDINRKPPSRDDLDEIRLAIDREGQGLRTPRDVKLVLNGIKFAYGSLADQVYFPDVCRINLIKILKPALYVWLEKYLSLRSVLATGDAMILEDERTILGEELKTILPSSDASSSQSIWGLRRFIPSVRAAESPKDMVFCSESDREVSSMRELKRLASPQHYRFYFALTGPKTVLTDLQFQELITLAEKDVAELRKKLIEYINLRRTLGKSWFEYIIEQLEVTRWKRLSMQQIQGLIVAITDVINDVMMIGDNSLPSMLDVGERTESSIRTGLLQLKKTDSQYFAAVLDKFWMESRSLNWVVGYFLRTELQYHGMTGNQQKLEHLQTLTEEQLNAAKDTLKKRLLDEKTRIEMQSAPHLPRFLFGWRDICGDDAPKAWVSDYTHEDANFVKFLMQMRSWSMSDRVYYPLRKASVSAFLDWAETLDRLAKLEASPVSSDMAVDIAEIRQAIEHGKEPGE